MSAKGDSNINPNPNPNPNPNLLFMVTAGNGYVIAPLTTSTDAAVNKKKLDNFIVQLLLNCAVKRKKFYFYNNFFSQVYCDNNEKFSQLKGVSICLDLSRFAIRRRLAHNSDFVSDDIAESPTEKSISC